MSSLVEDMVRELSWTQRASTKTSGACVRSNRTGARCARISLLGGVEWEHWVVHVQRTPRCSKKGRHQEKQRTKELAVEAWCDTRPRPKVLQRRLEWESEEQSTWIVGSMGSIACRRLENLSRTCRRSCRRQFNTLPGGRKGISFG